MVSKKPIEERIKDAEEKLKKRQEAAKNQLTELRNLQKAKSKSERAARTRELIELGGLVAIAKERHPKIDSAELILGVLDWAGEAADRPDKKEMIENFCDRGRKILAERSKN